MTLECSQNPTKRSKHSRWCPVKVRILQHFGAPQRNELLHLIILESYGLLYPSLCAWWRYQRYCFIACSMHLISWFCIKSRLFRIVETAKVSSRGIVHCRLKHSDLEKVSQHTKVFCSKGEQQKWFPSCSQFLGAGSGPHKFRPVRKDQEPTLQTGGLG